MILSELDKYNITSNLYVYESIIIQYYGND